MRPRLHRHLALPLALVLLLCQIAGAQSTPAPQPSQPAQTAQAPQNAQPKKEDPPTPFVNAEHRIVPVFLHDEYRMWTAPFRPGNYDTHTMEKYGLPFLLISGALIATDRKTADVLPNTTSQSVWSGRVSQMGESYTLAGFSGATYIFGRATGHSRAREAGFLGMEAVAHSGIIAGVLKAISQRERPLSNANHGRFWAGGSAFPSGHSANSFAVAAVFAYEYRDHIAVPITAYGLASVIAFSRLSARRHWASDIFVGSSMGFLVGRYVYKQHHDPELPGSPVNRAARLIPEIGFTERGPGLVWTF